MCIFTANLHEDALARIQHLESELERAVSQSIQCHAYWKEREAEWTTKRADYRARLKNLGDQLADAQEKENRAAKRNRELSEQISALTAELHDAHEQHASLRDHLQLQTSLEPKSIVAEFANIKRSIGKLCYNLTNSIVEHIVASRPDLKSTDGVAHPDALKHFLGHRSALISSPIGAGRPLEDFIDCVMCICLNEMLFSRVFYLFHPSLDHEKDKFIRRMYRDIQKTGIASLSIYNLWPLR